MRGALAGCSFDCADDVAVLEGGSLLGLAPLERLLTADAHVRVGDVMDAQAPWVVRPGADPEAVAWEVVRRGESSVAVLDGAGSALSGSFRRLD